MHALILAAGRSSSLADSTPTCLLEVGGRPLLSHQLDAARAAGAQRLTVVTGHGHDRVRALVAGEVDIVHNERFADTGSLYSFWLARSRVRGDVLVLNCDVLFPDHVLRGLLHRGSALAFDSRCAESREHIKATEEGRLVELNKEPLPQDTSGEHLGLLHLTDEVARAAFDTADELVRQGRDHDALSTAINIVAGRHSIACVDVAGLPWVEIDHPEDLDEARTEVWPAIAQLGTKFQGTTGRSSARPNGGIVRELGFSGERPVVHGESGRVTIT
ncbi:MAG: phosphocholine cytidylyltransferase family protein [Thermoleophilia bacterium]|nr:phosphocholine cytidylyltransferase family protein [Thermoleophilia bacterium]